MGTKVFTGDGGEGGYEASCFSGAVGEFDVAAGFASAQVETGYVG